MLGYVIFRIAIFLIGIVPFPLLYLCSDVLAFLLHKIIRYRRKVILKNLKNAFPDQSEEQGLLLLKDIYQNLSDIMLEGIKGMHCTQAVLEQRYKFLNPELVEAIFKKGNSAIGLVAHYANWEWGAFATAPQIKGQVIGVSKAIHNPYIDRYLKKNRARFGAKIIHMKETGRALIQNQSTPSLYVLIADQSPPSVRTAHWLNFLHQDTACISGPDRIARKTNYPVVYFEVQRVRRGYYEITASLLNEQPKQAAPEAITALYMAKLESVIRKNPVDWLWSHRRWKRKR